MRTRYKIYDKESVYFITSTIIDWHEIFRNNILCQILIDALTFKRSETKLKIFAYVIMPNHIHLILSSNNIIKFVKDFKSYTARKIIDVLKVNKEELILNKFLERKKLYKTSSTYQVWQEGFHPEMIFKMEMFLQKAEYIHNNPVRKGLVSKPEDWKYSSATNYFLGKGVLEIDSLL